MKRHIHIIPDESRQDTPRRPLDELGDLFISSPARDAVGPGAPGALAASALDDLLSDPHAAAEASELADDAVAPASTPVLAVLAGGLPAQRRRALALAAARRLTESDARAAGTTVVTFCGNRASVADLDGAGAAGHNASRRAPECLEGTAGRLVMVLAEHAGAYLAAGRRLPDHCVVLVTPEGDSLVDAYRELKSATSATTGPVPEIFVLEAGTDTEAERVYRRLARVAIAHLECTPTFAGACLETVPGESRPGASPLAGPEDADAVYQAIRPLLAGRGAPQAPAPDETRDVAGPPPTVTVHQGDPDAVRGETLPPVAGVVEVSRPPAAGPVFTTWEPASTSEVVDAACASVEGLLPGARGLLATDGVVDAPEQPEAVAVDADGRPVALLVADGADPDVLRRAIEARAWLSTYAALLSRAFPRSGLDPQPEGVRAVVLARDSDAAALEPLCPPHVALTAYTPVACGAVRGLLFRPVLQAVEPGMGAAANGTPPGEAAWPDTVARQSVGATAEDDQAEPLGSSPDDDLSADEMNDLASAFDIDELT